MFALPSFVTALIAPVSPYQRWYSSKGWFLCMSVQARKLQLTAEGGRAGDDSLVLGKTGKRQGGGKQRRTEEQALHRIS